MTSPGAYPRPVLDTNVAAIIDKTVDSVIGGQMDVSAAIENLNGQIKPLLAQTAAKYK